jgi:hypothetical protein
MPDREQPLSLWGLWWNAILLLRPAFSRLRTFMWFAIAVAGLTVRVDLLGVTSIVRALNLRPRLYTKLLDHFHSSGIKLDRLSALWAQAVLKLFPSPVWVNGRLVLVGDGIKAPKRGKKMPAVKLLHQKSESNTKPEYILITPSLRRALSPRDCSSISPSLLPSTFGNRSGPGCEPFVPASRRRSSSLQMRCARPFPNFSWVPQKAILSRNSSPIGKTQQICGYSA